MTEIGVSIDIFCPESGRKREAVPAPVTAKGVVPRVIRKRGYSLEMVGTMPAKPFCGMYTGSYIACTLADYGMIYREQEQEHSGKLIKGTCNGATCECCGISHDWEHPGVVEKKAITVAEVLEQTYARFKAEGVRLDFLNRQTGKHERYIELILSPPECDYGKYDRRDGLRHMARTAKGFAELVGMVGGARFAIHAKRDGDGRKNDKMEQYRRGEIDLPDGYHYHNVGFVPGTVRLKSDDFNLLTSRGIMAIYGAELLQEFAAMSRQDQAVKVAELVARHPELCAKGCDNRRTGWVYKLVPRSGWSYDKRDLKKKCCYEMDHGWLPAYNIVTRRKVRNSILYEGQEPEEGRHFIESDTHQHGHLYDFFGICHQSVISREDVPELDEQGNPKYKECKCKDCAAKWQYMHSHDMMTPLDQPGIRGDPVECTRLAVAIRPGALDRVVVKYRLTVAG